MSLCEKGLPDNVFLVCPYLGLNEIFVEYSRHGFALKEPGESGQIKDVGTVILDVETLVSGDGGTHIDTGDVLIHTAEF